MSEEVDKYHEEEEIGKTYDFRVARRLCGICGRIGIWSRRLWR